MPVKPKTAGSTRKTSRKGKAGGTAGSSGTYVYHGLQLVILDRGFVYVGDVKTDSDWCVVVNAKNVRRWGTTKGLGQLALKGPLPNTQLDDTGTVRAPMGAVISLIACNQRKWKR